MIHLRGGADAVRVRNALADYLPDDVLVMTRQQFVQREKDYWNSATPIGYIFAFGAVIGLVVGLIIVYQILFADVQDHLKEYATLEAMGYTVQQNSWGNLGDIQAIRIDGDEVEAAADSRGRGAVILISPDP